MQGNKTLDPAALEKMLQQVAQKDVRELVEKNTSYGESWRRRGGAGAFMMLARKWDRLENIVSSQEFGYDIFRALAHDRVSRNDLLDDVRDLRRYLMLVEQFLLHPTSEQYPAAEGYELVQMTEVRDADATRDYVDQK